MVIFLLPRSQNRKKLGAFNPEPGLKEERMGVPLIRFQPINLSAAILD